MNRVLVIANRVLYAVVIVAVGGLAATVTSGAPAPGPVEPLKLPGFTAPPPARPVPVVFPARNIFDPDGKPWLPPSPVAAAKTATAAEVAAGAARGLVVLPGVQGVLTDTGFVTAGQAMPEGELKRITDDGYVVSGVGGERTIGFDPERARGIYELFHPPAVKAEDASAVEAAPAPAAPPRPVQQPRPRPVVRPAAAAPQPQAQPAQPVRPQRPQRPAAQPAPGAQPPASQQPAALP